MDITPPVSPLLSSPLCEEVIGKFPHVFVQHGETLVEGVLVFCTIDGQFMLIYRPSPVVNPSGVDLDELHYIMKMVDMIGFTIKEAQAPGDYHRLTFIFSPHVFLTFPTFLFPDAATISSLQDLFVSYGFYCSPSYKRKDTQKFSVDSLFPDYPKQTRVRKEPPPRRPPKTLTPLPQHPRSFVGLTPAYQDRPHAEAHSTPPLEPAPTLDKVLSKSRQRLKDSQDLKALREDELKTFTNDEVRSCLFYSGVDTPIRGEVWAQCFPTNRVGVYHTGLMLAEMLEEASSTHWVQTVELIRLRRRADAQRRTSPGRRSTRASSSRTRRCTSRSSASSRRTAR